MRAGIFAALALAGAAACRSLPPAADVRRDLASGAVEGKAIAGVPFVPQPPHECGPAALAAVLQFHGLRISCEDIHDEKLVPGSLGTAMYELALASRQRGFFARDIRFPCEGEPSPMRRLVALVDEGFPVVVLVRRGPPFFGRFHYVVVTGYDDTRGLVLYQDGYEADAVDDYETFQDEWHDGDHWALVAFPPERDATFLSADDRIELAAVCERRESWDAAERHYAAALAERPGDATALVGRAGSLSHLGRAEEATALFERALEASPDSARALNNFAQHLVRCGGDLARAESLARRALTAAPDLAAHVQDTLGQVLAAQGDSAGARAAFEAAFAATRTDQSSLRDRIRRRLDALDGVASRPGG